MNFKKIFLLLFISVFVAAGFTACTKRDKLITNGMFLQIEPGDDFTLSVGEYKTLTAIIRNTKLERVSQPVIWSVSDSNIGHFSDEKAQTTKFIASGTGTATITLTCQGVTVSVKVTV